MKRGENRTRGNDRKACRAGGKWMEDMKERTLWISGIRGQGQENKPECKRQEREKASSNEEAYLNVRFPQVTNTVK